MRREKWSYSELIIDVMDEQPLHSYIIKKETII